MWVQVRRLDAAHPHHTHSTHPIDFTWNCGVRLMRSSTSPTEHLQLTYNLLLLTWNCGLRLMRSSQPCWSRRMRRMQPRLTGRLKRNLQDAGMVNARAEVSILIASRA